MSNLRTGNFASAPKHKSLLTPTTAKDWHVTLANLTLKAEKATDSLERMLAVCRCIISILTHLLQPGSRFQDTPSVILGQHYLSHRELGTFHRGDVTRAYVQEMCTYDPVEAPIQPQKYQAAGHTTVTTWTTDILPVAKVKTRKEGIIGSESHFIEISLQGGGSIEFTRHSENYTFTLPTLLLTAPLSKRCPVDFDGIVTVECNETGLRSTIKFKPWQDGKVKGDIARLAGEGETKVAQMEGSWQGQIQVHGIGNEAQGILYDSADFGPGIAPAVNLAKPGPQLVPRFWSGVLEAILFLKNDEKLSKSVAEMIGGLSGKMRNSLLYEIPDGPGKKAATCLADQDQILEATTDNLPLPPAIKFQNFLGREMHYQLKYTVQTIAHSILQD